MRYEKLLKSRLIDPANPYPSIYHSFDKGNLFFEDPQAKFPPKKLQIQQYVPSPREVFRNKVLEKIDRHNVNGAKHFKEYILEKFRKNCSKNTIAKCLFQCLSIPRLCPS